MITKIADNIISPLGTTTDENISAIIAGESMLERQENAFDLQEPFCASLLNRETLSQIFDKEVGQNSSLTFFEKLCVLSAKRAIEECNLSPREENVLFILSTTKGNVENLEKSLTDDRCFLSNSASKVARFFGNHNTPLVVSNACISGVCAQIAAVRELLSGKYRYAVIIGCDVLSKFIVSGFQSFKALSPEQCKPYDIDRVGLNLGEAVGTIILKAGNPSKDTYWQYVACAIHNDANHISGPSRTGEGTYRVLNDILNEVSVEEIGLVNGLKGYYGHTLGAAGIIETILSMKAIDKGLILATKGFEHIGTTHPVNISNQIRKTDKTVFIKILSGFGGTNAGIAYRKGGNK